MAIGKWIGGFLGWITTGSILGALAGYAIGSFIDVAISANGAQQGENYDNSNSGSNYNQGSRNSFLFSMLVLASYIIRADGKVMHSEMEFVRQFLRQNFGYEAERQGEEILLKLFEEQKRQGTATFRETIRKACVEINLNMNYSMRLQLLDFLVMIAQADGRVTNDELAALREVGQAMGLSANDIESLLAMGGFGNYQNNSRGGGSYQNQGGGYGGYQSEDELAKAYKILGVSPTATDDEVKKAYRQMALKHHPDKVSTLGEDVKKAAEKKFQEINNAKDIIYKARGL